MGSSTCAGTACREMPGYRQMLIDIAVCVNAAQAAYDLRQEVVKRTGKWNIEVFYGVFNILTHQVSMPVDPHAPFSPDAVNLAPAPTSPTQFHDLATRMAEMLVRESLAAGRAALAREESARSARPQRRQEPDGLNLHGDDHLGIESHD